MSAPPVLSRYIGVAERSLRALLDNQLGDAGLTFSEWTILVFLNDSSSLTTDELIDRQIAGQVVSDAGETLSTIQELQEKRLIASGHSTELRQRGSSVEDDRWVLTPEGESMFRPLFESVTAISRDIYRGLPVSDLEATQRTLSEITARAQQRLSAESP